MAISIFCDFDPKFPINNYFWKMTEKFKIFRMKKNVLYVTQLASSNHSVKFQVDALIFDPQKLNFILQHTSNGDVIQ